MVEQGGRCCRLWQPTELLDHVSLHTQLALVHGIHYEPAGARLGVAELKKAEPALSGTSSLVIYSPSPC